jgi:hypothetical protein
LVARFRARTKVVAWFPAIPTGKVARKGMDGLDSPHTVHKVDNIQVKSLGKVSLDAFEGVFGLMMSKINDGLIA